MGPKKSTTEVDNGGAKENQANPEPTGAITRAEVQSGLDGLRAGFEGLQDQFKELKELIAALSARSTADRAISVSETGIPPRNTQVVRERPPHLDSTSRNPGLGRSRSATESDSQASDSEEAHLDDHHLRHDSRTPTATTHLDDRRSRSYSRNLSDRSGRKDTFSNRGVQGSDPKPPFSMFKVKDPDLYEGDRESLPGFLMSMRTIMELGDQVPVSEAQKVWWATTFFRNRAALWWEPYSVMRRSERPDWMYDFDLFCEKITTVFDDGNREHEAEIKVMTMTQGRDSIADYHSRFMTSALKIKWDEKALLSNFRRGLNNNILVALAGHKRKYRTLETFVDIAIKIDNQLREVVARDRRGRTGTSYVDYGPRDRRGSSRYDAPRRDREKDHKAEGIRSMRSVRFDDRRRQESSDEGGKLDNPTSRTLPPKEKGKCWTCGSGNHYSPDCPRKTKTFNKMILADSEVDGGEEGDGESGRDSGSEDEVLNAKSD